jgi:hypothetical protein
MKTTLMVGDILYGFCGGYFGREAYGNKKIEGLGNGWVVARCTTSDQIYFYEGPHVNLLQYTEEN